MNVAGMGQEMADTEFVGNWLTTKIVTTAKILLRSRIAILLSAGLFKQDKRW
jgi:hypothetical protein